LLLGKTLQKNNGVLIFTPKNPSAQKDAFENYETHREKWARAELSKYPDSFFIRDSPHQIVYIGTKDSTQTHARTLLWCAEN